MGYPRTYQEAGKTGEFRAPRVGRLRDVSEPKSVNIDVSVVNTDAL